LKRLDEAWSDQKTNIISLIAEGGAGKSALVNEWLKQLQADNYRGAQSVLGWSFYNQGTKERATSAEQFLNWVLQKLGVKIETTSTTGKADSIAEEMMRRRVLLLIDGAEPLQHGPGPQHGQLKDIGLRALLRRFAATSSGVHGLIVVTSRLQLGDIARWQDGPAPVIHVGNLTDEAAAGLLRDNGVWGMDRELKAAANEFSNHPLALGLLAGFLTETDSGDVRRRDHIRGLLQDAENPGYAHARRVMESYETEWLVGQPVLLAIMRMVGLFDRPASRRCLFALRTSPVIQGLTNSLVDLDEMIWQRSVKQLRKARLLSPSGASALDELDAHPLVREWFGERLREENEEAYKAAHSRIYEYLRDTTKEGNTPTLENLAPLYQAITHGCLAGKYNETLSYIFEARICKNKPNFGYFYSRTVLGAFGADLAAISSFFQRPYDKPVPELFPIKRAWVLNDAANGLIAQGRIEEALPALDEAFKTAEAMDDSQNAMIYLSNYSEAKLLQGQISSALETSKRALEFAKEDVEPHPRIGVLVYLANSLHASGLREEAEQRLIEAERVQRNYQPAFPILYSAAGYAYCDLLLEKDNLISVQERALRTLQWAKERRYIRDASFDSLALGRVMARLSIRTYHQGQTQRAKDVVEVAKKVLDTALEGMRRSGQVAAVATGLLTRAAFRRQLGEWQGASRDLGEVEETAEPAPMRLHLCDMALERARLALAKVEASPLLNGILGKGNPPKPVVPNADESARLKAEADKQLKIAADYIDKCGYHRRDEELAELEAVLRGERTFASLPPRV
jgi:tetratricopeptide (TPR) repeat protein